MSKKADKTTFYCDVCGFESSKWLGQCPSCKAWDSFVESESVESIIEKSLHQNLDTKATKLISKSIEEIEIKAEDRLVTGISEFDNLLGGGIVKGSITLMGGAPGIGKSTMLLQVVRALGEKKLNVLYVSGEESLNQIKHRAVRIGKFEDAVRFIADTNMDAVLKTIISDKPDFVVIDSIQTMALNLEDKIPGSITQVRACTQAIFRVCKEHNISVFIIGHITKEGTVAGPKLLEHIVDTVLYFEDDTKSNLRILRCKKNRFGSSDVIAVFEMVGSGLHEVKNPSEIFIDTKRDDTTGSTVTCIIEGNRPILIEVQALVTKSSFGISRRNISGGDLNRLNLLIAVIEKRMNLPLYQYDIYVNITGGFKVRDTGIDLAIIMAIISSYNEKKLGTKCMYCGEVGLSGEVRNISSANLRVKEAAKLGFKKIFIPSTALSSIEDSIYKEYKDVEIKGVKDVLV